MKNAFLLLFLITLVSCKSDAHKELSKPIEGKPSVLKYAKGFSITDFGTYKLLEIKNPWPKADETFEYRLTNARQETTRAKQTEGSIIDIKTPINTIVVTSTTHIPALELLGAANTLIGFPGSDYVSSEKIRQRIDTGEVRELGRNEGINTEVLLELQPDVVIGFGIDGSSKSLSTIKKAGIPLIYNGDWVETSPLAKAEWIKLFGLLFNKEKEADSIFNRIESDYLKAKELASKVENMPSVLSGAMHKDVWYLPNGTSPEAQLLKDANANYLWSETTGSGSLALNFEAVFDKAQNADLWLSPSYYPTMEALQKANQHYTKFQAFQNKTIYTFSNTTGKTGGVLYYELGLARPDLVLKDLIKICHPELLENYTPYFFKPLE